MILWVAKYWFTKTSGSFEFGPRPQFGFENPIHNITGVEYVRFVACNWGFYPRGMSPFLHRTEQCICPWNFLGVL